MRQRDGSDCGPAALLSALRFWDGDASLAQVREMAGTGPRGSTLFGLRNAAERLGFEARGARGSYDALLNQSEPFLAHLVLENGRSHFVTVFRVEGGRVHIGDPATGRRTLSRPEFERLWRSRSVLLLTPTDELASDRPPGWIAWLGRHLLDERTWLVQSLFLGALSTAAGLATALFVQRLIDRFIPAGDRPLILVTGGILLVLLLLRSGATYLRERFLVRLNRRVGIEVNSEFLALLYRLPLRFFTGREKGDVTARLSDGVKIQRGLIVLVGTLVIDGLVVVGSFGFLLLLASPLALLAAALLPFQAIALIRGSGTLGARQREAMEGYADVESAYIDGLSGVTAILDHAVASSFAEAQARLFQRFQTRVDGVGRARATLALMSQLTAGLLVVSSLVAGSLLVVAGSLQLGELMAAYSLLAGIVPSVERLFQSGVTYQETAVAAGRLRDVMLVPTEGGEGVAAPRVECGLEVEGVDLSWPGGEAVFERLNLRIPVGRLTGLWGPNGAGKTTLVRLLNGTVRPDRGRVLADGLPISRYAPESFRRRVAVVPAEPHVFSHTLGFNVLLGRCQDRADSTLEGLQNLGFEGLLDRFSNGWGTRIGEGARRLSSGERQALGLLRALVGFPDFLLVDEGVTSTDDSISQLLLDTLVRYSWERGVLIVSHDRHVLLHTRHLMVLEDGGIVDEGEPEQVLARNRWSRGPGSAARDDRLRRSLSFAAYGEDDPSVPEHSRLHS